MPSNNIHCLAYKDVAELIYFALRKQGFDCTFGFNQIVFNGSQNIVLGFQHLDPSLINSLPPETILFNLEPIYDEGHQFRKSVLSWAHAYEMWDFAKSNQIFLNSVGVNAKFFEFGYQEDMRRIEPAKEDIDVLFFWLNVP
jgi:hypothetical protein